ncbi:transcriptional regulator [Salipiger aestuarii]|uniref:IclR family transcriptional regulator n=1 Tax=Salipiger aestuarii TaxID=568098 RepID=A0A327Y4B7_9RHOB|nr:IclR family transcriptional regulator [Salipiger aestuarii]EIE50952.1 IclR family transcriptional regulator [Citreicella sp. 357]KAA8607734.1 transcriptional regulator [Salipiger aestuarii]KAA8609405.1 transcriptional regulator [Salipiger aestuarii]KAB2542000.1 transcriptional regulator [Salipiger aestuarii]RAK15604.1 IclR family transcriptional regulator [Salipiger aestuarii]
MPQSRRVQDRDPPQVAGAQSVTRALKLLPLLGRDPQRGASLPEIVAYTGLSRPTARRLLLSLIHAGLAEQDALTKRYLLGEETYVLGSLAAQRFGLIDMAHEAIARLAQGTADTAYLSMRRDGFAVCLHKEEGAYPIRTQALQVGFRHPLGVGAGSLAILAALPDDEVDEMLAQNARLLATEYPRVTQPAVLNAVAEARARGWALNPGMVLENSWAVGRALRRPDGRVVGALSVAAIDSRLGPERQHDIAAQLDTAVTEVEARLARLYARHMPRAIA